MLWEIPALAVLMELRSRAVLGEMGRFELQILYARAMTKLWEKIEYLRPIDGLRIADFGTRRRHSFLWQDWCVRAMTEGLGKGFVGTSNCLIAKNRDLEAIGTNAHELPMIYAALAKDDAELARAPYAVLSDWHEEHDGNLRIILPDTYGTPGFLDERARLAGALDRHPHRLGRSGGHGRGRHRLVEIPRRGPARETDHLLRRAGGGPHRRPAPPVRRAGQGVLRLGHHADQRFPGPDRGRHARPLQPGLQGGQANGQPTVKLSDNPEKAMGPVDEIARYKRVFGVGEQERLEVVV